MITMLGYSEQELVKYTGLSSDVIHRVFSEVAPSLTSDEQKVLEDFIRHPFYDITSDKKYPDAVRETASAYGSAAAEAEDWIQKAAIPIKKPGTYTLEDYMALPVDCPAELSDGNLYRMEAPSFIHQIIGGELHRQISNFIISHKGSCIACTAPADILLDRDDRTAVQPDVFVICDRGNITRKHGMGAPDLVIEVLSPSTKKKDMNLKRDKYQRAGVREYWMIDPDKQKVIVENFEGDQDITIYSFTNKIPVHIFPDNCEIDFAQVYEQVKFLYEKP